MFLHSAKAEKNSRPISNGFAASVISQLSDIHTLLFNHIENHGIYIPQESPNQLKLKLELEEEKEIT